MRRIVVVGSAGQDGRILFERCARDRDCAVLGLGVGGVTEVGFGIEAPATPVDIRDGGGVDRFVERVVPDEIYFLAAHHRSAEERPEELSELRRCFDVHVTGIVNVLEAVRTHAPGCRVFFAGSSQMFGRPHVSPQDETTPFAPINSYAITKVTGAHVCAQYRERHGVHVSVGILYNHESPLRGSRFVSARIAAGARQAARESAFKLMIGDLSAVVDWGYAPDYVDAMVRIVSSTTPDDYVIASGEPHTVGEFVEVAFAHVGLDWRKHVQEDADLVVVPAVRGVPIVGNASKLRALTGWRPSIGFEQLVRLLVDSC